MHDDHYEAVKRVFEDELGIQGDVFSPDLSYNGVPEWDSASHMVIILALEERFGLEFDSDEIVTLTSVEHIVNALKAKQVHAQ